MFSRNSKILQWAILISCKRRFSYKSSSFMHDLLTCTVLMSSRRILVTIFHYTLTVIINRTASCLHVSCFVNWTNCHKFTDINCDICERDTVVSSTRSFYCIRFAFHSCDSGGLHRWFI